MKANQSVHECNIYIFNIFYIDPSQDQRRSSGRRSFERIRSIYESCDWWVCGVQKRWIKKSDWNGSSSRELSCNARSQRQGVKLNHELIQHSNVFLSCYLRYEPLCKLYGNRNINMYAKMRIFFIWNVDQIDKTETVFIIQVICWICT